MIEDDYRIQQDELHEECGVFGVYHNEDAASLTYYGLHALQHRGQEGCGIASSDASAIYTHRGHGLVQEVFTTQSIEKLMGELAIGHVRYATAGGNELENVQPLHANLNHGEFSVCHNGQIVNAKDLRIELENKGSIFQGTSDSEIILHLIQREKGTFLERIKRAFSKLEGAFAALVLTNDSIFAIRDHNGLRPLSYASLQDGYCISSESCAFLTTSAEFIADVEPGEVVCFTPQGIVKDHYREMKQCAMCAMEYIYFSRPDSDIDGINVHDARKRSGILMAKKDQDTLHADIVVGVPDSSTSAAIGYAQESGLPYEIGLIKNRYVGRTFIQPTQTQRERGVRMKLSAISAIVAGKDVVLIDDSIVRGTTSKRIVQLLIEAGAHKVHVRIGSPAFQYPCFYGVDTSTYEELISARMSEEELCAYLQADSLKFLEVEDLSVAFQTKNLCTSCFHGVYPTSLYEYQQVIDHKPARKELVESYHLNFEEEK
ncbi:MAG: amidophosphoribosyltransferase [Longicatena sp.]